MCWKLDTADHRSDEIYGRAKLKRHYRPNIEKHKIKSASHEADPVGAEDKHLARSADLCWTQRFLNKLPNKLHFEPQLRVVVRGDGSGALA